MCEILSRDKHLKHLESYTVPEMDVAVRLSDFFKADTFKTIASRKAMKNAIKKGLVKINGKTGYTGDYLRGGELIEIFRNETENVKPSIDFKLEVIYEDEFLAVVNKPCGIVVSGNKRWTLENSLPGNIKRSSEPDALIRPEPVHRLDYPTSGTLLVAKTSSAVRLLNKIFEEREIKKFYAAVTIGNQPKSGVIEKEIEGKASESEFEVLQRIISPKYDFLNLTKLKPNTGRRHQLRIHLLTIGHPIFGDLKYGIDGLKLKGKGLYLHASCLSFVHPFTHEKKKVLAPLPSKFVKLFPDCQKYF